MARAKQSEMVDEQEMARLVAQSVDATPLPEDDDYAPSDGKRTRDVFDPPKETRDETPTTVVCVVETLPWTHRRPLKWKEKTVVPRWVADLMAQKGQVVIV